MKFSEAMKALEEGKKVKRDKWPSDKYIKISNKLIVKSQKGRSNDYEFSLLTRHLLADDWEIYQEPEDTGLYAWKWQPRLSLKWFLHTTLMTKKDAEISLGQWYNYEIHAGPFEVGKGES